MEKQSGQKLLELQQALETTKLEKALKNILWKIFTALSPSQIFLSFFLSTVIPDLGFSGFCVLDSMIFWLFLTFFQSLFYIAPIEFSPLQPLNYTTISLLLLLKSKSSISLFFSLGIFDPFPDHIKISNCKMLLTQGLKPAYYWTAYWCQVLLLFCSLDGFLFSLCHKKCTACSTHLLNCCLILYHLFQVFKFKCFLYSFLAHEFISNSFIRSDYFLHLSFYSSHVTNSIHASCVCRPGFGKNFFYELSLW